MLDEELCLKWDEFTPSMTSLLSTLLYSEEFVDVTLTAAGHNIKCHKLVLSACSPYFQDLFRDNPCQHPVVILRDVEYSWLKAVVEYMYRGEVKILRSDVDGVMKAAEALQVRGLVKLEQQKHETKISLKTSEQQISQGWMSTATAQDLTLAALPCKKRRLTGSTDSLAPLIHTRESKPVFRESAGLRETGLPITRVVSPQDMSDIRPDILEMIKEEQKAKMVEMSHGWMSSSTSTSPGCSMNYQTQLQNMWQKCWNQNSSVFQGLRYRERGPMKSWRPETMAEAIWSVLNEGLSLSQAARKHDIPYPTFVLYANRVHNMLGPSVLNSLSGGDLRPKGRGRPQRILLGQWPEDHVRHVIRAVVFRDGAMSETPPPVLNSETPTPPPTQPSLASESKSAQAAFELQMKNFYNNPLASQLLAASSKMYHQFEEGRLMSGYIKQEISDPSYEDAEEDETMSSSRDKDRSKDEIQVSSRTGRDGATDEKMLSGQDERLSSREGRIIGQDGRMDESSQVKGIDEQKGDQGEDGFKNDVGELSQRISALSQDEFRKRSQETSLNFDSGRFSEDTEKFRGSIGRFSGDGDRFSAERERFSGVGERFSTESERFASDTERFNPEVILTELNKNSHSNNNTKDVSSMRQSILAQQDPS